MCPRKKYNFFHVCDKYDLIWKDALHNAHTATGFYFLIYYHLKQRDLENVKFLLANYSFALGSFFLLFWLKLPHPNTTTGHFQFKKEESESEEEEK